VLKKWPYILILLSVFIIVSHNIIAHHHHHEIEATHHDHNDDTDEDGDHNLFSFGQLDETYIHSNDQVQVNNSFVSLFYIQPVFSCNINSPSAKQEFSITEIFLPPDNYCCQSHSLRGPPIS